MPTTLNSENALEDTRQRIIDAATQLFAEVGYGQATTRMIAATAGVNEVTLFRHFGNKKGLLMACVQAVNAKGFASTFEAELSGVYSTDIMKMAQLHVDDMRANVELLRMMICDVRSIPELRQVLLEGGRGNQARMSRYFQGQIQAGVVRDELSADALAIAFESLFSWSILFEYVFQDTPSQELTIDELVHPMVDVFVRGTMRAD